MLHNNNEGFFSDHTACSTAFGQTVDPDWEFTHWDLIIGI